MYRILLLLLLLLLSACDRPTSSAPQQQDPSDRVPQNNFDGQTLFDARSRHAVHVISDHADSWSHGTGFFVSVTGHSCRIATDAHVITGLPAKTKKNSEGRLEVSVGGTARIYMPGQRSSTYFVATLELLDLAHDLAILRIDKVSDPARVCPIVELYAGSRYRGDHIVNVGTESNSAKYYQYRGGWGTLVQRDLTGDIKWKIPLFGENPSSVVVRLSAYVSPGDSGGPIFNAVGQVILVAVGGDDKEPMGWGTPVQYLIEDLERVEKRGRVDDGTFIYVANR